MADGVEHSLFGGPVEPIEILSTQEEHASTAAASTAPVLALAAAGTAGTDTHHSASSADMHSAPTLAIVPHSTPSPLRPHPAGMHRHSPFSQPTVADLFSAVHRLEEVAHTLTVNQRGVALQLSTLSTSMSELQRHVSTLEQRITRQREQQDELDSNAYSAHSRVSGMQSTLNEHSNTLDALDNTAHNAHVRISDVQSTLSEHSSALEGMQHTLHQASSDVRQLRRRIGHAFQVMGAHINED